MQKLLPINACHSLKSGMDDDYLLSFADIERLKLEDIIVLTTWLEQQVANLSIVAPEVHQCGCCTEQPHLYTFIVLLLAVLLVFWFAAHVDWASVCWEVPCCCFHNLLYSNEIKTKKEKKSCHLAIIQGGLHGQGRPGSALYNAVYDDIQPGIIHVHFSSCTEEFAVSLGMST